MGMGVSMGLLEERGWDEVVWDTVGTKQVGMGWRWMGAGNGDGGMDWRWVGDGVRVKEMDNLPPVNIEAPVK